MSMDSIDICNRASQLSGPPDREWGDRFCRILELLGARLTEDRAEAERCPWTGELLLAPWPPAVSKRQWPPSTWIVPLPPRVLEPIAFADRAPEAKDMDDQERCFLGRPSPEDPAFWDWSHEANEDCTHWLPIHTPCLPTRRVVI